MEVLALHVTARVPTQAVPTQAVTYGRLLPCGLTTLNPCCLSALVTVSQPHTQRRHVQVTVPVQRCHAERAHPFPSARPCCTSNTHTQCGHMWNAYICVCMLLVLLQFRVDRRNRTGVTPVTPLIASLHLPELSTPKETLKM